ncbi:MAG: DUF4179 domain-containing protein [Candidatus Limnocylindrales bacterium]
MTMHSALPGAIPEDLESLLAAVYAVEMPTDLAALVDRRVKRAVRDWRPRTSEGWRLTRPRWWRLALVPVLAAVMTAALLMATSASGGPAAFYSFGGGYAWQHAEQLGLTKTVDGYRITLERAYADANQMMLAFTVVDAQNRGWSQVDVGSMSVADSSGGNWTMTGGASDPVNVTSAATIRWFEHASGPAEPGRRAFTVTVSSVSVRNQEDGPPPSDLTWDPWHPVAVNATFSFELTVGGGPPATGGGGPPATGGGGPPATGGGGPPATAMVGGCSPATVGVAPQPTVGGGPQATVGGGPQATVGGGSPPMPHVWSESHGVTLTLESIVTSPSQVRLELRLAGAPSGGLNWTPIVDCVSHNGQNLDVATGTSRIGSSLTTVYTSVGVEDPTGDWTVWVSQLMGDGTEAANQGQDVRYDGNWTLHFSMP